jgi:AraC family transcriptional regulator
MPISPAQFYGALSRSWSVRGVTLAETCYQPDAVVPSHVHDRALFCLVLDGGLIERNERETTLYDAGSLFFHPAGQAHSHRFGRAPTRCFSIQVADGWARRAQEHGLPCPERPLDLRSTRAPWWATLMHRELARSDDASDLIVEGLLLAMMGEAARALLPATPRSVPPWLRRARELVDNSGRARLHLGRIASEVGVHPVHLSRSFHRYFGTTMSEYLRRRRLEEARDRLATGDRPIARIALDAGFADQSHFSRAFKQVMGVTPGRYRHMRQC